VNGEARRAHAHAGDQALVTELEAAGVARHVGGRAAHVEADDARKAGLFGDAGGRDHASGGAGEDGVRRAKARGVRQTAARLHQAQGRAGELLQERREVGSEQGSEVRVERGGLGAREQARLARELVRQAHEVEARPARDFGDPALHDAARVIVHDHDAEALRTRGRELLQRGVERSRFGRLDDRRAVRGEPCVELDDSLGERRVALDLEREQVGARLVADEQEIGEAARDGERGAYAFSLEQRVGGERGPEANLTGWDRRVLREPEQAPDTDQWRSIGRQHLEDGELARLAIVTDAVGERTAAIDPELVARLDHQT
jgi:hypothetical protein